MTGERAGEDERIHCPNCHFSFPDASQQAMQGLEEANKNLHFVCNEYEKDIQRLQEEVERLTADILEEQVKYAQQCLKMLPPKVEEMCKKIVDAYVFQLDERLSLQQQLADQRAELDESIKQRDLWQQKASDLLQGPHVIISQEACDERKAAMQGLVGALQHAKGLLLSAPPALPCASSQLWRQKVGKFLNDEQANATLAAAAKLTEKTNADIKS